MGPWTNDLIGLLFGAVLTGLTAATQACLNWALGMLSATVFASPDVTVLPQVRYMSTQATVVANAFMTLFVIVVGVLAMTHGSVQDRYSLKELLPRMLIGFAAVNLASPIVAVAISGANALTAALLPGPFNTADSFTQIRRVLQAGQIGRPTQLLGMVLQLMAVAMLLLLIITWLGRLASLLVIAATGPVALLCHALPQTDPVARIWWRSLVGVLAVQVLQALTLHLAVATLLTGNANFPSLGLPTDPTGLLNMLITCYLLWLVIRIPVWVARTIGGTSARGSGILGHVVRVVVVQQLLGAVGLRGGRRFGRGARGTGRRPAAPQLPPHQHANSHLPQQAHPHPGGLAGSGAGRPPGAPAPGGAPAARPHPAAPYSASVVPAGAAAPGPTRPPGPGSRPAG